MGYSRWNAHLNRFRPPHASLTSASPASGPQLAASAAAITGHVEAHLTRSLLDGPRSMARRACLRRSDGPCSMTSFASVHPRDGKLFYGAAHRVPKINLQLVFQVAAWFVLRFRGRAAPPAKKLAEQITEACAAPTARASADRKSAKIKIHARVVRALVASRIAARR